MSQNVPCFFIPKLITEPNFLFVPLFFLEITFVLKSSKIIIICLHEPKNDFNKTLAIWEIKIGLEKKTSDCFLNTFIFQSKKYVYKNWQILFYKNYGFLNYFDDFSI